jgi:hypothetical protein
MKFVSNLVTKDEYGVEDMCVIINVFSYGLCLIHDLPIVPMEFYQMSAGIKSMQCAAQEVHRYPWNFTNVFRH